MEDFVQSIRAALAANADPERAVGQQRYMKSAMPYRGLTLPQLRNILRPLLAARIHSEDDWAAGALCLWDEAAYREERYAAIALLRHRHYRHWAGAAPYLELYLHLVRTGAWWDLVDEIAAHLVGGVLAADRVAITPVLLDWARDPDLWVRRTAILSQIRHRDETDRGLLVACIEPSLNDRDFFARKAIGWALREYSKTGDAAANWVVETVAGLGDQLSPLSRREALKRIA